MANDGCLLFAPPEYDYAAVDAAENEEESDECSQCQKNNEPERHRLRGVLADQGCPLQVRKLLRRGLLQLPFVAAGGQA